MPAASEDCTGRHHTAAAARPVKRKQRRDDRREHSRSAAAVSCCRRFSVLLMAASASAALDAQDAVDAGKIDYKSLPPINIASQSSTHSGDALLRALRGDAHAAVVCAACVVRSRLGVEFRTGPFSAFTPTTGAGLRSDAGADGQVLYSADGKLVALVSQKNVQIIDTATQKTITTIVRHRRTRN